MANTAVVLARSLRPATINYLYDYAKPTDSITMGRPPGCNDRLAGVFGICD
jgi:hypothetical protein